MKKRILYYLSSALLGFYIFYMTASIIEVRVAYTMVANEISRQHKLAQALCNRPKEEQAKLRQSERLLEEFQLKIYNDFFEIDPFGVTGAEESIFIQNIGSKSSFLASFYCWVQGNSSNLNKETSLKCLRSLWYFESPKQNWLSRMRRQFAKVSLINMSEKRNENERIEAINKAIRSQIQAGKGAGEGPEKRVK